MTNPFDDPFEADDPFGDDDFEPTKDEFAQIDWLFDRLCLIWPLEIIQKQGTDKMYDSAVCDVVVLDGPTNKDIPKIPFKFDRMHLNSPYIQQDIKHLIGKGKPKLARIINKKSDKRSTSTNTVYARILRAPTKEDETIARQYFASLRGK